jgi:hypothetical protein
MNSLKIQWNHLAYMDTFCCCVCNYFITFTFTQMQCKYLSNTFTCGCVNVLGACKCNCIYYILSIVTPFCKSILILIMNASQKLYFILFAMEHYFDFPSQKIIIFWYSPNINIFFINMGLWWCYSKEYIECTFCVKDIQIHKKKG